MKLKAIISIFLITFSTCLITNQSQLNAMSVEVSAGEFFDKISILEIKKEKIKDPQKNQNVCAELALLKEQYNRLPTTEEKELFLQELFSVNSILWDLEDDIRAKESIQSFDKEFIQMARNIYITNGKRYAIKQKINSFFNSAIVEEKSH